MNGELRGGTGGRIAALTSGGAIPETGDYRVVAEPDDTFIGTVNEDWAVESMAGDIFLLGTHSWQIRRVEPGVVRVRDAGDANPTVPFWMGEAPARTAELSTEVSELRRQVDEHLAAGDPDGARAWVMATTGLREVAAALIVDYLAVGRAVLGVTPTQEHLVLERFFDDTGGMQLVLHSPNGGRINRALGLALRKKFCRSFNFELQAAASDDAIVLSLGPHHSFPLEEVSRYVSSKTVEDTLRQAILDSPMFLARWRWTLNRSLLILRFRNGRKNPPPIQRMEADDLMAALFPQAAACQENITGPIEIPDHLLVRQAISDTLTEAMDLEGVRGLLERMESGEVTVHCVRHHRGVGARARDHHRAACTRSWTTRSCRTAARTRCSSGGGSAWTSARSARSEPAAIERVREEVTPEPTMADDLHDLLSSLVVARARDEWRASWTELTARGRGRVLERDGVELWCTTERHEDARAGAPGRGAGRRRGAAGSARDLRRDHRRRAGRGNDAVGVAGGRRARRAPERGLRAPRSLHRVRHDRVGRPPVAGPHALVLEAHAPRTGRRRSPRRTSSGSCCGGSTSRRARSCPARRGSWPRSTSSRVTRPRRSRGSPSC